MSANKNGNRSQSNQTIDVTTENVLFKLKGRYILMMRQKVRSWKVFLILGFVAGFAAAFLFTSSADFTQGLFAQPVLKTIQNTASADYQDTQGRQMQQVISNAVSISVLPNTQQQIQPPQDTTLPGRITTLFPDFNITQTSIPLHWSAVGDDAYTGAAFEYDIRYSTTEIKDDPSFASASQIASEPKPQSAGAQENYTVANLQNDTVYWIALKARDEAGNASELSNVVRVRTGKALAPISDPRYVSKIKIVIALEKNHTNNIPQVRLRIRDILTKQVKVELIQDADAQGAIEYTPNNVKKEIVDLVIQAPHTLTKVVKNVDLGAIETAAMTVSGIKVGNLQDADDVINSLDWAVLSGKWGTGDKDADLNQDGLINSLDWGIMNKIWGAKGEEN